MFNFGFIKLVFFLDFVEKRSTEKKTCSHSNDIINDQEQVSDKQAAG